MASRVEKDFLRYTRRGDGEALARVFDALAPKLLLLAAHVVRDRAQAEDLVQETFLRAMASAETYDASRPLFPWLVGILHNEARMARRSAQRSPDPDRVRHLLETNHVDDLENRDLLDQLTRAVTTLPEIYRDVLNLRIHGLEAVDIAHALGRPPSTVHTQLQRGMEMLRRSLPASLATCMLVTSVPARGLDAVRETVLTEAGTVVHATSTVAFSFGGILLMKKALVVAAGLIALLAFLGLEVFRSPSPSLPASTDSEAAAMQSSLPPPEEPPNEIARSSVRSDLQVTGEEELEPGSLVVEVTIEGTGAPAEGVGVTVSQSDGRDILLSQKLGQTDGRGQVKFDGLSPGPVRVEAGAERSQVRIEPGGSSHVQMRVLLGITVEGEVVDAKGRPVTGAKVSYFASVPNATSPSLSLSQPIRPIPVAITGDSGRFVIPSLVRPAYLAATAPGHVPSPLYSPRRLGGEPRKRYSLPPVKPTPASELSVALRIQLGASSGQLSGVVLGEDGLPLAGAHIDLLPELRQGRQTDEGHYVYGGQPQHTLTGATGEFSFDVPPRSQLVVRAEGHAIYREEMHVPAGSHEEVTIALLPGRRVFGRVKSIAGAVLPGAQVYTSSGPQAVRARTSADGSFELDLPVGAAMRVYAEEDEHLGAELELQPGTTEPIRWDPELEPMTRLRGRVMDEVGRPLGGWNLEVRPPTQPYRAPYFPRSAAIEADGRFDVGVLPGKPYGLKLKEPGQWLPIDLSHVGELYGGRPEVVVVVDASKRATASVEGVLRDAAGQPIAGASLQLHDGPLTALLDLQTSETGHFFIGPLMPRPYRLTAWGSERNLSRIDLLEFDLDAEQHLDLGNVSIAPAGTLNVTVVRQDGGSMEELELSTFAISDKDEETRMDLDETGRGDIRLPVGIYDLGVFATGFTTVYRKVTVAAGQVTDARVVLRPGERISIDVFFSDVSGLTRVELAWMTVTHPGGDSSYRRHIEIREGKLYWHDMPLADGTPTPLNYSAILAPGSYGLEIETETGHLFRGSFTVRGNAVPDVAGELAPIPVVVSPVRR